MKYLLQDALLVQNLVGKFFFNKVEHHGDRYFFGFGKVTTMERSKSQFPVGSNINYDRSRQHYGLSNWGKICKFGRGPSNDHSYSITIHLAWLFLMIRTIN